MSRRSHFAVLRVVLALAIALGSDVAAPLGAQQPKDPQELQDLSLSGRLATVEPSARRLTMIPENQVDRIELLLGDGAEIFQQEKKLSLSELVIEVGRRITVRYRMNNGVREARSITVEPPPAG